MDERPIEQGDRSPETSGGVRLRLRGQGDEGTLTFPLAEGDNLVGSAVANAVVLPLRGVSRHHAAIQVEGGAASVVDLGSKNGVLVNGRLVRRSALAPGDEVTFGAASLRLEEIAAGDAEVGLALPPPGGEPEAPASEPGATSRLGGGEAPAMSWLGLIDEVVARLSLPPGDPQGALATVVRRLGLSGAAVVEWQGVADPVLEVAAGRLGELPRGHDVAARGGPRTRLRVGSDGAPAALWAEPAAGGRVFGLALWGDFPGRRDCAPLLGCLGRLFRGARVEPLAELGGAEGSEGPGLAFPEGYVAGESAAMRALYRQMETVADSDLPVLISGETGVGKEPLVRTLHASSAGRGGPFVAVNCAAIPAELLEAEMFGIGRNVATGVSGRRGKFVEASGGTLFLDEIGDMPLALQAKLLRALQEKEVQPVGSAPVSVDVRVVAATNRELRGRVGDGGFRRDLYYRLAGCVLDVPPLRRRPEDLPQLIGHFLRRSGREAGKAVRGLTVKALRHLAAYPWPGNVRELEHEMRRLVYLCPSGGVIDSLMLPDHVLAPAAAGEDLRGEEPPATLDLRTHTDSLEARLIQLALARTEGNQSRAAALLGISRNGLANRLKRLGIDPASPGVP